MSDMWRVGRKVGRTIYIQSGPEPSDDDQLVGVMDTPILAAAAVIAANNIDAAESEVERLRRALSDIHYICIETKDAVVAATRAAEIAEDHLGRPEET